MGALCACLLTTGALAQETLTPDGLLGLIVEDGKLRLPRGYRDGSLAWSPDGKYLFYSQVPRRPERSAPQILKVDIRSGQISAFASGAFVVFSPDGRRAAIGEGARLRIAEVGSDFSLRRVRSIELDRTGSLGMSRIPSIAWSPDSTRVTFVVVASSAHDGRGPPAERHASAFELRLFDVRNGSQRKLHEVRGINGGIGSVVWTSNEQLLIASGSQESPGVRKAQIAYLDARTGESRTLIVDPGIAAWTLRPLVSPDGKWLSYWRDDAATSPVPLGFGLAIHSLREGTTRRAPFTLYADGPIAWQPDAGRVHFTCKSGAFTSSICAVDPTTAASVDVRNFSPLENIEWFAFSPDGRSLAWRSRDVYDVERVRILDIDTGAQRVVSEEALLDRSVAVSEITEVSWHSFDGLRLGGLLVKPLGYVAGRRYPLIVDVHGGPNGGISPAAALLNASPLEWQLWAAQGYAVLVADYREGGVYAPDNRHSRRSPGRYLNDEEAADIVAGARFAIDSGIADPQRLAIIGHSHGSTLTNWLLTRTQCFAAAVSKEGRTDWRWMPPGWESFYQYYFNASAARLPAVMARNSALDYAQRVRTPLLYINGQHGLGAQEGRKFVEAIRHNGVPARWLSLEGEGHVIQSAANMQHMLEQTAEFLRTALTAGNSAAGNCDVPAVLSEPFEE